MVKRKIGTKINKGIEGKCTEVLPPWPLTLRLKWTNLKSNPP